MSVNQRFKNRKHVELTTKQIFRSQKKQYVGFNALFKYAKSHKTKLKSYQYIQSDEHKNNESSIYGN